MFSILFSLKKERTIEQQVSEIQQGNQTLHNQLIQQYKPFIIKTVSNVCKRFIREEDDELSIGLIAFNEAIEKYAPHKGSSFISFAELLIKRRLIDYIRKEARVREVILHTDEDDENAVQTYLDTKLSIDEFYKQIEQEQRREEIIHYQQVLKEFGIHFHDLVEQSPKHKDARINAIKVAKLLVEDEKLLKLLFQKKQLPIKQLQNMAEVSRKTIERNRKYIIAVAIILAGDYVYLKDYIKGVLPS
ncbi:RNA polymerase sigma factor [Saccharococcus thermophilus]|jgi:RNA polymerase sigma factor|uniref:RNA polymerase sigma factor SigI n=2 Tax=Saccharococcus thermophilus TaxID=29396 RepID=A0A846MK98_9BACL|nr:RNA polymerase sigma factor SigI [Saccharococcus thermophilus]NIK16058.1 RNA polymerase sigma factor [Saccharococcus thermophilus]